MVVAPWYSDVSRLLIAGGYIVQVGLRVGSL